MRIGIIGLLHESNTFLTTPTEIEAFQQNTLLTGPDIVDHFRDGHHEISGFLAELEAARAEGADVTAVPIFVGRALPSGIITRECWAELMQRMEAAVTAAGPLDGILVAPHGATVSEDFPDADGYWLSRLRQLVGTRVPLIGTIDPHANLSPEMVAACDALIAYRSNPHLDQYQRGREAAALMRRTLMNEIHPVMRAAFPPLAINIERQMTEEPHWTGPYQLADQQLERPGILSNSIVLGFPYADVAEMGASTIVVTDGDPQLASTSADELARSIWKERDQLTGQLIEVSDAIHRLPRLAPPVCLLDMGDNVGGGSAADGTILLQGLESAGVANAFVCIYDPAAVVACDAAGIGATIQLAIGGKSDDAHGPPLTTTVTVKSLHDGKFRETAVRHGGISEFDQGRTAVVQTDRGNTIMLTTRRMVPFSLEQLRSCGLNPAGFTCLVAKGVNAPVAAYREVCATFLRVNTPGSTCADMRQLAYLNRRRPLFPFENCEWPTPAS